MCAAFLFLYAAFLLDSVLIENERPFPQYRYNLTAEPVSGLTLFRVFAKQNDILNTT